MLVQAFNDMDQDGSGTICKEELMNLLVKENPEIKEDMVEYIISEADTN